MAQAPKTPDEAEIDRIKAEQDAGGDPFGDDDDAAAPEGADAAAAADPEAPETPENGDAGDTGDTDDDAGDSGDTGDTAAAADPAPAAPAPPEPAAQQQEAPEPDEPDEPDDDEAPPPFRGELPGDIAKQRLELRAKQLKARRDALEGNIDPADEERIVNETQEQLDKLLADQIRAETRLEQIDEYRTRVLQGLMARGARQGIDYKNDAAAQSQFDAALNALMAANPTGRTFKALAHEAHAIVLGVRGVARARAPAPAAAKTAPAQRTTPKPPPTLRNVPAAASPALGATIEQSLSSLKGQAFEEAFARLTPAQRERLLTE